MCDIIRCVEKMINRRLKEIVQAWGMNVTYTEGMRVGLDSIEYICIKANMADPANMPGQGEDWTTYWTANLPKKASAKAKTKVEAVKA